ncbi:WD40 repeat-like protein, partial [Tilletiopsis washingtonensis]
LQTLAGHRGPITSLDFSEPYGALVSSSGEEASPLVWDLSSGTQVGRLRGHTAGVRALQVEEELCITGSQDATVRLWDLRRVEDWETRLEMKNGEEEEQEPHVRLAASADAAAKDKEEWNPMLRKLEGHTKAVTSLYFDEGCLITGASDKTLRQWDLNTGQCVLTMDILWAASGAEAALHSWEMYTDFVGAVQFWGYALASASGDGAVRMWDMRTGQAHRTLLGHTAPVTCLQFDETHVVSGSLDKSIRV